MTTPELNLAWARALLDELLRGSLRHACVSPGSRSSPLALAIAERAELSISVHIDERSAGFFALGCARASGVPAILVCTSGTAGANYYPAVIEAYQSRVPMVILTADRPAELRETGAWQTIDQARLFGGYARWFVDVPAPVDDPFMWRYLRSIAGRAVAIARGLPPGPVHLNLQFREPLVPIRSAGLGDAPDPSGRPDNPPRTVGGRPGRLPWISTSPPLTRTDFKQLFALAEHIADEPRGLILAGALDPSPGYAKALTTLAAASGYPILAEPLGGLRYGDHPKTQVVTGHAAFLRVPAWADTHAPRLVLRFGASHTWRHVAEFLDRHPDAHQVIVDPGGTWDDPTRRAALWLQAEARDLVAGLNDMLGFGEGEPLVALDDEDRARAARAWTADWLAADAVVRDITRAVVAEAAPDTIAWVYPLLLEALPDRALLYVANSMAVRDLDTFTWPSDKTIRAIANRGAAGIDGTVSSALGAAAGASSPPTVLVTGDLAFLHDLNGLGAVVGGAPAARAAGLDLTIIVLNDDGGGIFAHLPIAEHDAATFERFFRTPTGADLAAACATFHVPHVRASGPAELAAALGRMEMPGIRSGVRVIEVPIDLAANTALHRRLWAAVADTLGDAAPGADLPA